MKTTPIIRRGMMVGALLFAGCAVDVAGRPNAQSTVTAQLVTQDQARQLTTHYRRQAADLRDLAQRMEWEARW